MLKPLLKPLLRQFLRVICRLLFRVRVEGDPAPLHEKRLLIVANHESFLDGLLLGLFLPVEPVFVVHSQIAARPLFRALLALVDYLPVDAANPLAMKRVVKLIESGRPVMIFPEGRITVTGSLMKVYDGPAFAAARTGATVVPVRLDGPARSYFSRLAGEAPKRLFPAIRLSIRPPARIAVPAGGSARARRKKAGEAMRRLLQAMVFHSTPRLTLWGAFLEAMRREGRGREIAEDIRFVPVSYGGLLKTALGAGRALAREAGAGDNVGVLLPNLVPTVGVLLGLSAHGRVPAMLNHTAGADGVHAAVAAARIRVVVTSRAFIDKARLGPLVAALPEVAWQYLEDLPARLSLRDRLWLAWAWLFPAAALPAGDAEAPGVVLFTSGSEGSPKGVVLSHRALTANIAQIRAVVDMHGGDKVFNALPLFHSFGLTAGTLLPVLTGVPVFLYVSPLHYRVVPELVYDRNCTVLFATPTFLANFARFAHPYDFFKLRFVVAGAEKLSEAVRQTWFDKFGIRLLEGYGATETAPVLAVNTPMSYRAGTVGQFLPGIEHRLIPVPGIERGGRLAVRGPNLMSGYLRVTAPGVLEPPVAEPGPGWYDTGDVVEVDGDGFVRIAGRVKRFAKVAGEMVSLESVEKLAVHAAPEAQHAATHVPDAARGECIVLYSTVALERDRLAAAARELGLPELALPRRIERVDALPLLGTGKVDYVALKKLAEASA